MNVRRPVAALAVVAMLSASAGTAFAFDCIRTSTSLQGLQQSTRSGNWLLFDFSSPSGVSSTFADVFGFPLSTADATCVADQYALSGQPRFFALGIGVAGARNESVSNGGARSTGDGFGVLAWHNKNYKVLSDGRGVDHLDDSPIVGALFGAAAVCNVAIPED